MMFHIRWYWNSFKFWIGATNISPATKEILRVFEKNGWTDVTRGKK